MYACGRKLDGVRGIPGLLVLVMVAAVLSGCASPQQDRFEEINRPIRKFNDQLDRIVIKPMAIGYTDVTPAPVRTGVTNFFNNLGYPLVAVNQFLQGKPGLGVQDTSRFLVNSTLGLAGLMDPATGMGLLRHEEDFGQTFGVWGAQPGDYFVVPLFGGETTRDGFGDLLTGLLYPPRYIDDLLVRWSVSGLDLVDTRANYLGTEDLVTGDRYVFLRDSYLQRRAFLVRDGAPSDDAFTDDGF